jgi:transposase-like protein
MRYSLNSLYSSIGISKQAVYKYHRCQVEIDLKVSTLLPLADKIRKEHPGCGVQKLYEKLQPDFIGRDGFIDTFMQLGYRVKRKKNYKRTTVAGKTRLPNLIKSMKINSPSTVWQSDITYISMNGKHYYATFIIDVYTKKIVGHNVANHMRASANIEALHLALKCHEAPQVHHSDRGGQYISDGYLAALDRENIKSSMAYSAQDNAYAERINRTIKEEYLAYWKPNNFKQLRRNVNRAVKDYNSKRSHKNLGKMTPIQFEAQCAITPIKERKTITIFNNELITE